MCRIGHKFNFSFIHVLEGINEEQEKTPSHELRLQFIVEGLWLLALHIPSNL